MIPALAFIVTAAETLFGVFLVLGWKTRVTAFVSGVLLTAFALAMTMALGVKALSILSVFSAAGEPFFWQLARSFPSAWTTDFDCADGRH